MTYHVEFSLGDESGDGECDHGAGGQSEVRIDDSSVLTLADRSRTVEARPEQPQEYRTSTTPQHITSHHAQSVSLVARSFVY